MSEMVLVVLFYFFGIFIGAMFFSNEDDIEKILGTTYTELSSMKGECELVIPRNQECIASIVFLPTAIEE